MTDAPAAAYREDGCPLSTHMRIPSPDVVRIFQSCDRRPRPDDVPQAVKGDAAAPGASREDAP